MSKLKTASVLAFERKLCCSDGLMYAGMWNDRGIETSWNEVPLQHKDVRGTISNRLKSELASNPMKLDAEVQKPNLQAVDIASLPFDADTLKLVFTLRVLGNVSLPSACNDQEYQMALMNKVEGYLKEEQCGAIALRYAENLANGRFLWRNRVGAEAIEVRVHVLEGGASKQTWVFDSSKFSLRGFSDNPTENLQQLAEVIKTGLLGKSYILLKVEAFARIGQAQEVFPSQELVRDAGNDKYKKSKFLYSVNDIAALHSQKIGNALRTIDTWYEGVEECGPIAVEPYGSVTSRGIAYRQPKKTTPDFYTLLDAWVLKDKIPPVEQQHFVIACLIRGGVFGEKDKE